MIIGRYVVNPLEVLYGEKKWEPDVPTYTVTIVIIDGDGVTMNLSQFVSLETEADKYMKLIDKCISERKEAMLNGDIDFGDDFEGEHD